jgi:CheY-like chemotaxis protein
MLVDDGKDQIALMRRVFYHVDPSIGVSSAMDGDEALKMLRSGSMPRPHVILLDLKMPKKDGIEVLKELKADDSLRTIPVCVFSSGDLADDIRAAYENCASFYFCKPSGLEALKAFAQSFKSIWFDFACHCQ